MPTSTPALLREEKHPRDVLAHHYLARDTPVPPFMHMMTSHLFSPHAWKTSLHPQPQESQPPPQPAAKPAKPTPRTRTLFNRLHPFLARANHRIEQAVRDLTADLVALKRARRERVQLRVRPLRRRLLRVQAQPGGERLPMRKVLVRREVRVEKEESVVERNGTTPAGVMQARKLRFPSGTGVRDDTRGAKGRAEREGTRAVAVGTTSKRMPFGDPRGARGQKLSGREVRLAMREAKRAMREAKRAKAVAAEAKRLRLRKLPVGTRAQKELDAAAAAEREARAAARVARFQEEGLRKFVSGPREGLVKGVSGEERWALGERDQDQDQGGAEEVVGRRKVRGRRRVRMRRVRGWRKRDREEERRRVEKKASKKELRETVLGWLV